MACAKPGDVVKVHYTGSFEDGTVFDSSEGREPFEFVVGVGQVVPGFDRAVLGMEEGATKTVTITPEEGYGKRYDDLVVTFPRADLPPGLEPKVGMNLHIESEDGDVAEVVVTAVDESSITVDQNHPLAGKSLTFEIKLVEISQST